MAEPLVLAEKLEGGVGLLRLNRPQVLNALNTALMKELAEKVREMEADPEIGCLVLMGNGRAFAAGADIQEMAEKSPVDMELSEPFSSWDAIYRCKKPIIAAVHGYALGGGLELAMMCDIIVAAEDAKLGQPEIKLGVIPGAGGTQRLPRAVGKAAAMEMVLTGEPISAERAFQLGLVSKVVAPEVLLEEALKLARSIAEKPRVAVRMAKEAILAAFETPLSEGLRFERRAFYFLFASEDQKEGMKAFMERRPPRFKGR
ncbi:MAG: enoyl-CoA hydratase/isomerase family protein [Clostridiales bacterium]|nr:enoyl-CoA hydratase/isomerase family protein [Clostridiales bacterium]